MGWIQTLSDTYDAYSDLAGKCVNGQPTLLPISHSTANAQIEIAIDYNGNFKSNQCRKIDKGTDEVTIIPVTEDSASRSSGISPHPLCDKLCYVAGDYSLYTKDSKEDYYTAYITQLGEWAHWSESNKMVQAVYLYLEKGSLINDLLSIKMLELDDKGVLTDKVNKIQGLGQTGAFIRFRVIGDETGVETDVWKDEELFHNYIKYYSTKLTKEDLCYGTGKYMPCSEKHPSKIRNSGDKAKLISANDESGFTFRGRFVNKSEASSVGYETSQKAHNALRWLLQKQGYTRDGAAIVCWEIHGKSVPDITESSLNLCDDDDDDFGIDDEPDFDTAAIYAKKLSAVISGYSSKLTMNDKIIIIGLDSATTGRMSISFYQELFGKDYIDNVVSWHSKCTCNRVIKVHDKATDKDKHIYFKGAPSLRDIALAAYGTDRGNGYLQADDKLIRSTVERLLPCVVNKNKRIPSNIVRSVVIRASQPEHFSEFVWKNNILAIAVALIKYSDKYYKGDESKMTISDEINKNDRSFLFGRLLAVMDEVEIVALYRASKDSGEKTDMRTTNAKRYWNSYSRRPISTYKTILESLRPYFTKIGHGSENYYEGIMNEITALMDADDFNNLPLNERYIVGYSTQMNEFRKSRKANANVKGGEDNE